MIKRVISIILIISIALSVCPCAYAKEKLKYGCLEVQYLGDEEKTVRLPVMIRKKNLYVNAESIANLFGYSCNYNVNSYGISLLTDKSNMLIFFEDNKLFYKCGGIIYNYKLPFEYIINENGAWIPFQYSLFALDSYPFVSNKKIYIHKPQPNLLDIYHENSRQFFENITFDIVKELGTTNLYAATSRETNLLNGLLDLEPSSIVTVITQYFGNWYLYDYEYGDKIAALFASKSDNEYMEVVEQANGIYDLLFDAGELGGAIDGVDDFFDNEIKFWDEYSKLLKSNNATLFSYNKALDHLDSTMKQKDIWNSISKPIREIQKDAFPSTDNVTYALTLLSFTLSTISYYNEFENCDEGSIEALRQFTRRTKDADNYTPKGGIDGLVNFLNIYDSSDEAKINYSMAKSLLNHIEAYAGKLIEFVVKSTGGDPSFSVTRRVLGAEGTVVYVAWNLAKIFVPYVKNGLERTELSDVSIYAMLMQKDSLDWARTGYYSLLADYSDESAKQEFAYAMYSYMKFSYIARNAGIAMVHTLPSAENNKEVIDYISQLESKNKYVASFLPLCLNAASGSDPDAFGFTPKKERAVKKNYDDSVLIKRVQVNDEEPSTEADNKEKSHSNETQSHKEKYSDDVFYSYWNNYLIPKYGLVKKTSLKKDDGSKITLYTGSISVLLYDIDNDEQKEMLHIGLGKYGNSKDCVILEIYEYADNQVKKTASAVLDENYSWSQGDGFVSVCLSKKNNQYYIFCEDRKYVDNSLDAYLVLQYDGQSLIYCHSIIDPGFTSDIELWSETSGKWVKTDKNGVTHYWEKFWEDYYEGKDSYTEKIYAENYDGQGIYVEDEGCYMTGKYTNYNKALEDELGRYGISWISKDDKTNLDKSSIIKICKHINTGSVYESESHSNSAAVYDYTGCLYHVDDDYTKKLNLSDGDNQYNFNIYLSNFSEVLLPSFSGLPDNNTLITFGEAHNRRNNESTVDYNVSDNYMYRMKEEKIAKTVKKYFEVWLDEGDFVNYAKKFDGIMHKKGYLYSDDPPYGFAYGNFTVVNKIQSIGNNMYRIAFATYPDALFYGFYNSTYPVPYHLTASEVKKLKISKENNGIAIIYASNLKKRDTYRLLAYSLY